jgi:thiol-disulfide isomerase/thioredoxin
MNTLFYEVYFMSQRTRRVIETLLIALIFASTALLTSPLAVSALPSRQEANKVVLYMFWGDGCPHCATAKPVLEDLAKKNPQVELRFYEVWYDDQNAALLDKMCAAYGFKATAVPTIFIGDKYWIGYSDQIAEEIAAQVDACSKTACRDAGAGVIPGVVEQPQEPVSNPVDPTNIETISLPFIGKISLSHQSLFVSTLLISFVDGFNPCSVWVLTMLLALTLHTGSRRKVVIIGLIFLTVTAFIYALFIAGLFTVLTYVSIVGWVQVVVALVALFFSIINIKDYFW